MQESMVSLTAVVWLPAAIFSETTHYQISTAPTVCCDWFALVLGRSTSTHRYNNSRRVLICRESEKFSCKFYRKQCFWSDRWRISSVEPLLGLIFLRNGDGTLPWNGLLQSFVCTNIDIQWTAEKLFCCCWVSHSFLNVFGSALRFDTQWWSERKGKRKDSYHCGFIRWPVTLAHYYDCHSGG